MGGVIVESVGEGTGGECGWRRRVARRAARRAAWRRGGVASRACSRPLREAQFRATKTAEARREAARASRPLAFHTTGAEPHMAIEERRKYVTGTCDAPRRVSIAASTCHGNRASVKPLRCGASVAIWR